jgi:hypothetical protein
MRRETSSDREAWTAFVEGREVKPTNKYSAIRTNSGPGSGFHSGSINISSVIYCIYGI